MIDDQIYEYSACFKKAIERARDAGLFENDISFYKFPNACCGDTCDLLAEFLHHQGIDTIYVCGDLDRQSHAWLVVKDGRVKMPTKRYVGIPSEVRAALNKYGNDQYNERVETCHYEESDIDQGLIIDITADQFGELGVYVNYMGDFHGQFAFENAHDYNGLATARLERIYDIILKFID